MPSSISAQNEVYSMLLILSQTNLNQIIPPALSECPETIPSEIPHSRLQSGSWDESQPHRKEHFSWLLECLHIRVQENHPMVLTVKITAFFSSVGEKMQKINVSFFHLPTWVLGQQLPRKSDKIKRTMNHQMTSRNIFTVLFL